MTTVFPPDLDFGINLDTINERLKGLAYFVAVEDILAASEILSDPDAYGFAPPAAFTSVASETGDAIELIGGEASLVNVTVSVLFAEASARINRGADDQVELTRRAIIRQLMGWTPGGAARALRYRRYLLRATGGGLVWGEVLFETRYRLTAA